MTVFEYQISLYPADDFQELVYFCSETSECEPQKVSRGQITKLGDALNQLGKQGWELVQICFSKESIMAFWKRRIEKES